MLDTVAVIPGMDRRGEGPRPCFSLFRRLAVFVFSCGKESFVLP